MINNKIINCVLNIKKAIDLLSIAFITLSIIIFLTPYAAESTVKFTPSRDQRLYPQKNINFNDVQYFKQNTKRNINLERRLIQMGESHGEGIEIEYIYYTVDLNSDGKPETIVNLYSSLYGRMGSPFYIFNGRDNKYRSIVANGFNFNVILPTKTKGWNDIIAKSMDGSTPPTNQYRFMKFDSNKYKHTIYVPARSKIRGKVIVANSFKLPSQ